jgi:hypothetical protein
MPTNLYGPNDNYDLANSHVLPALIRKAHEAKQRGDSELVVWGSGTPMREFLYVDDLADACVSWYGMAADRFWWDAFLGRLRRYRFDDPILAPAVIPRSVVALNLAERNRGDSDVSHYWVSKKPDGVRAVWDGKSLRFLSGNTVPLPPQGFVDALPSLCWIASFGSGAVASAIVRRLSLEHVAWRRVRRRIFELSDAAGSYSERIEQTKAEARSW